MRKIVDDMQIFNDISRETNMTEANAIVWVPYVEP